MKFKIEIIPPPPFPLEILSSGGDPNARFAPSKQGVFLADTVTFEKMLNVEGPEKVLLTLEKCASSGFSWWRWVVRNMDSYWNSSIS